MKCFFRIQVLVFTIVFGNAFVFASDFRLPQASLNKINHLLDTHGPKIKRVESCPLISNGHAGLVSKLQIITHLFKDKCLDGNQRLLDEIMKNAQALQDTLNEVASYNTDRREINVGSIPANVAYNFDQSGEFVVSGQQIAKLFNNINGIFRSNSCQIEDRRFLSELADVLQGFAQLGLFVPNQNGLIIAGGGLALSSILNILDSALDKRFDFEDPNSRQTFTKLNCAFYDIRKDLTNTGLIDVATEEHKTALVETKFWQKQLKTKMDTFEKKFQARITELDDAVEAIVMDKFPKHNQLWSDLKQVSSLVKSFELNQITKLFLIDQISTNARRIQQDLKVYIASLNKDNENFFESLLKKDVEKFFKENLAELIALDDDVFIQDFLKRLSYSVEKVFGHLDGVRGEVKEDVIANYYVGDILLKDYLEAYTKDYKKAKSKIENLISMLVTLESKLENIIERQDYRSSKDGSDNFVSIMIMYEKIAEQIFGKHGYNFLDYTVQESNRHGDKFRTEATRLLGTSSLSNPNDVYFCQDAFYARNSWRVSEGLIQHAYDFIEANKDLIHSQQLNSYKRREKRRIDRIKMHFESAEYAKRVLDENAGELDAANWYINSTYRLFKKHKTLGKVMLDFEATKSDAIKLQSIIHINKCEQSTQALK